MQQTCPLTAHTSRRIVLTFPGPLNLNGFNLLTAKENIMLKHHARRLAFRLIVLLALAGGLLVTSADVSQNAAHAAAACPCDLEYQACIATCPPIGQPGRFACIRDCNEAWEDCQPSCF